MNEADKIRMKNYEQQIDMLEKENKALRKELFKYKLKEGESDVDESAQEILEKIRSRNKTVTAKKASRTPSPYDCSISRIINT